MKTTPMYLISLYLDGLNDAVDQGIMPWMLEQGADVYCLQNTKANYPDLDDSKFVLDGYFEYFFPCGEDSKGGVAIYTKVLPKALIHGLGFPSCDYEGRYLQADFERFSVCTLTVPGGPSDPDGDLDTFLDAWLPCIERQANKRRPFILGAHIGVAHTFRDLDNPDDNSETPGHRIKDQTRMDELFQNTHVIDLHRLNNPDAQLRSWTSPEGDKWRLDYLLASNSLENKIEVADDFEPFEGISATPLAIDVLLDPDMPLPPVRRY